MIFSAPLISAQHEPRDGRALYAREAAAEAEAESFANAIANAEDDQLGGLLNRRWERVSGFCIWSFSGQGGYMCVSTATGLRKATISCTKTGYHMKPCTWRA